VKNRIPPPLIALSLAALMWLVADYWPASVVQLQWQWVLAMELALAGIVVDLVALAHFRKSQTTINPLQPHKASSLVTEGVFQWSRNPMYVGMLLILTGWGVWLGSVVNVVWLVVFVVVINEWQIKPEEKALETLFGEEFRAYCRQVRRWI